MNTDPWLLCRRPQPMAGIRLYCFPHSGGSPGEYLRWADDLPGVEVHGVQLPGRGTRLDEKPYTDMGQLVSALAAELPLRAPYALFGHSLGALVAYELARELLGRGGGPVHLIVSAYQAPHLPRQRQTVRALPDAELLELALSGHPDLPAELRDDPEFVADLLTAYRADLTIVETYQPAAHPPLPVPITVLGGSDDDGGVDPLADWRVHTTARFELHVLPGGHFYLRQERAAVLRLIEQALRGTR
ncbi:thioesterase II family protein [Allorhizocola rhizosphaerae]|uniref:thioesterase II family protein n=1 Tax=Allorhizocola rhizosphaerae TaxID=1872709 RepID=UPI000E3D7276|nr:alpha/beta fold hydrolase [Allorhizocola rhizosphaerae]